MIRINLVQKKQASYVSAASVGGGGVASSFASLKGLGSGGLGGFVPLLKRMGIPLVLSVITNYGYDYYVQIRQDEMAAELATRDQEKDKINKELQKIKGFESVKVELERNELILRTKIDTIEKLIRGRDHTPKTMIALVQSMPRELWFTEINAGEMSYEIRGGAIDIGLISDLMSRLGKTIYFKDINLKNTASDPTGRQSTFEITARRE